LKKKQSILTNTKQDRLKILWEFLTWFLEHQDKSRSC